MLKDQFLSTKDSEPGMEHSPSLPNLQTHKLVDSIAGSLEDTPINRQVSATPEDDGK
jgi:hypothetical protein